MKRFFNTNHLLVKITSLVFARSVLLRLFVQFTFPYFPVSDYIAYSRLDDVYRNGFPPALWGWGNFDGNHYIGIAMRGYSGFEHPFFPFYPWLIRTFADQGVTPLFAAEFISFFAKLIALFFMVQLLRLDNRAKLIWPLVIILMFFPTSFYFSSAYNDGLFLLLATTTIYFARKKYWLVAGLISGVATLTRLNGLVLPIFICVEYLLTRPQKVNFQVLAVIFSPLAFVGYLIYTQMTAGSWRLVFTDMVMWGQDKMILLPQVFWRYIKILLIYPNFTTAYFTAVVEVLFVIGYIYLLVHFFKKIRLSYWILFGISLLIPSLTGTFQGMPRYCLHLYPFFLMLAMLWDRGSLRIKISYLTASIFVLLLLATMFVHGYFIA